MRRPSLVGMRRPVVWLLAAVVVTVAVVVTGVLTLGRSGAGDTGRPPPATRRSTAPFTTTPLSAFDTSTAVVGRAAFCERIDPHQVTAALGGATTAERSWSNGDRVALGSSGKDVVHEFGCEYVAADGTTARAWVFAPPVTAARAQQLVASASQAKGCTASAQPAFGQPSVGLTCTAKGEGSASYRGLFGDAWLSCEIDVPVGGADPKQLADRAGRWCVGVVRATRPPDVP
jgi:hypothetical protein